MSQDIEGQRAIVVGAASGIGRAAATLLAERGALTICADIQEAEVKSVASDLRSRGLSAEALVVDVELSDSIDTCVSSAVDPDGLDILVNCAGITGATGIAGHEVDEDDFDRVYRVNLRGSFLLSKAVLPVMSDSGYGRVLHVASIAGKEGNAGMLAYSATKAGIIGMVKTLGKDYALQGVTVNALAPAVIQTPMVERLPQPQVEYMTARIPMGRTGSLDEAAELIAWIVSPACSYITGFTFDLSGGRAVY